MDRVRRLPRDTYTRMALAAIVLLGLGLRLYCLDCRSLWYDEVASLETAQRGISGIFSYRFGWLGNQTPVHYLIVWLTALPVDPRASAALVRLPSALAGAMTLVLVYGIGRELFGRAQGLLAALLVALSEEHLAQSQDVRPYAMLVFLTAASVYCLVVAERTGSGWWWLGFALSSIANSLNSYVAVLLFAPALALYLIWVLWRVWKGRKPSPRAAAYATIAVVASWLAALVMLVQLAQMPRDVQGLGGVTIPYVAGVVGRLLLWFAQADTGTGLEEFTQLAFVLLFVLGAYSALRSGEHAWRGLALCAVLVLVPSILLSIMSAAFLAIPRYVLFALPFYLLLVANGIVFLVSLGLAAGRREPSRVAATVTGGVLLATALLVFAAGAYSYNAPYGATHRLFRPEYGAVTAYLSGVARPTDVIVFVDDPGLGYTVAGYYWRGHPPAPTFDVQDPRLYAQNRAASIYWVVSSLDPRVLAGVSSTDVAGVGVTAFEGVAVLHETATGPLPDAVDRMARRLEAAGMGAHAVEAIRGTLYQARGKTQAAASAYRLAGVASTSLAGEYLRTARGFQAKGDMSRAWREGLVAKWMSPGDAAVHEWLAEALSSLGEMAASRVESTVAAALAERQAVSDMGMQRAR